jgi:hypothetical protein
MFSGMDELDDIERRQREVERIAESAEFTRRQRQESECARISHAASFGPGAEETRAADAARLARRVNAALRAVLFVVRRFVRRKSPASRAESAM